MILFDSSNHQEIMTMDSAVAAMAEINDRGTIGGEEFDALFKLKKSHPWYSKIRTTEEDGTPIEPPPVVDSVEAHYWLTFSRQETADWVSGIWQSGEGYTSHSDFIATPEGFYSS